MLMHMKSANLLLTKSVRMVQLESDLPSKPSAKGSNVTK